LENDPHLYYEISIKGLARSKAFNWEHTGKQTLAIYESVYL